MILFLASFFTAFKEEIVFLFLILAKLQTLFVFHYFFLLMKYYFTIFLFFQDPMLYLVVMFP